MPKQVKIVFISWAKTMPRTAGIAHPLGADDFYIQRLKGTPLSLLPLRYLLQILDTLWILWRRRPTVIIVSNPPILLPLIACAAARILKAQLLIDSHTGAFGEKWARFLWLHRFLSRHAAATIVTNEPLARLVRSWGAVALVLEDRVPDLPTEAGPSNERFTVTFVSSFAPDEPIEAVMAAAGELPEYAFFVTGKPTPRIAPILAAAPLNVSLTGFLPRSDYIALLNRSDVIMVLVKRDLTLLCGAYEAVAVEKPLITSDWPVLKSYFNAGALYVDNSPNSIVNAVVEAEHSSKRLRIEMRQLKRTLEHSWNDRFAALKALVAQSWDADKADPRAGIKRRDVAKRALG